MAYDILKDDKQRESYNNKLTLTNQSSGDFFKLKRGAQSYVESVGEYVPPNDQQKLSFLEQMSELDKKHNFDSTKIDPISKKDAEKKYNELATRRVRDELELKPEKLFEGETFSGEKFNAMFDKVHRKDDAITGYNGVPSAWNDMGRVANFSSFDNLDNLYVENKDRLDTSRQVYGDVDFGLPMKKVTKKEMDDIVGADYVEGHCVRGDDYYLDMKQKIRNVTSRNTI